MEIMIVITIALLIDRTYLSGAVRLWNEDSLISGDKSTQRIYSKQTAIPFIKDNIFGGKGLQYKLYYGIY